MRSLRGRLVAAIGLVALVSLAVAVTIGAVLTGARSSGTP